MIDVKTYPVAHGKEKGGGGVTYITGSVANSDLPDNINVSTINASNGNIDYLTGKSMSFNDAQFIYFASNEGVIQKISGNDLNYVNGVISNLTSDTINTGKITADEADIKKAIVDVLQANDITTQNLTVTGTAHFFELVIDKIKSVGGTIIETAANCIIDYVKAYDSNDDEVIYDETIIKEEVKAAHPAWTDQQIQTETISIRNSRLSIVTYFNIFWRATNELGRGVKNEWEINDQAICQSFNAVEGVSQNVSNKYYWRLVTDKLNPRYMNLNSGDELPADTPSINLVNTAHIINPTVTYTKYIDDPNSTPEHPLPPIIVTPSPIVNIGWICTPMYGATWNGSTSEVTYQNTSMEGDMTTTNTVFGIQLTTYPQEPYEGDPPEAQFNVGNVVPTNLYFTCGSKERLGVGVIYKDETSQYFPAPETATDVYDLSLTTNSNIETVFITNAVEAEWRLVNGIKLSNENRATTQDSSAGCGYYIGPSTVHPYDVSAIPEKDDNLVQLGYRYTNVADRSRSSAIIIAAYNTIDNGYINSQDPNDHLDPIEPPSYAQYRDIIDFNLGRHRKTYFDAKGAKFVGDFEIAGQDIQTYIDGQISSTAPTYYLYTAYCDFVDGDPTHKDPTLYPNNVIHFSLSYDQNQAYMGIWSTTVSPQPTNPNTAVNYEWMYIQGSQGQQGPAGPTGAPGSHIEFAYKNATNNPLQNGATTPLNTYPSGFATAVTSPPTGQATWMTQSVWGVQGATYLTWNPAIRITGDKGNPGEDGTEIEFIYTRNNGNNGSPNPPAAPPSTFDPGPTGATYNGVYWTNHPVGVAEATMYEYVCQRIKGPTGVWGAYQPSPAAVWSKWGVKGQDGDGYEYIYKAGATYGQLPSTIVYDKDGNLRTQEYIQTHDDFVPMGWYDEPVTLSATSGPEWVSTRKKEDGLWGAFSEPKVWAHWAEPGSVGPTGPQGPTGPKGDPGDGADAIQYKIIDVGSYANISATLSDDPNVTDPAQTLTMSLSYKVAKIVGATATIMKTSEINDLGANVYYRLSKEERDGYAANYYYYKLNVVNDNNNNEAKFVISYTTSSKKIIDDNNSIAIAFIKSTASSFTISSPEASKMYDTVQIVPVMQPSATFRILQGQNAAISSLVTGASAIGATITNMWTQINQNASAISLNAETTTTAINDINDSIDSINTQIANINIGASAITSKVENLNVGTKNYFNFTYCKFQSTAFPFIQGYGLEGYGNYMQVRNLDFQTNPININVPNPPTPDTIKLAVRCEMRMRQLQNNVKVGLCDMPPSNIGGNKKVLVTTTWQTFSFVYEVPNTTDKFLPDTANGHITFTPSTGSSSDNRLQVRNLMITKGDIPNDVNISWKDYESQMTREQALVVADDEWVYDQHYMREITDEPIFKGFKVYGHTSGNDLPVDTNLIFKNGLSLKQNKIYTLSFYAKDVATYSEPYDNYTYDAYMHENGGCVNSNMGIVIDAKRIDTNYNVGQPSVGNNNDGITKYMLNRGWQQFIIHWFNANSGNRNVIAMRSLVAQPYRMYIAGVELREGWWDVDGINSSSMIKQTADEIELKVKKTGINIDDGTIELTANKTTINGNFELHSGDQGLKIYDANGNEKISVYPDNITGINASNYPEKVNYNGANRQVYNYSNGASTKYTEATAGLLDTTVNFMSINIGNVNTGGQVKIDDLIIYPTDNHNATAVLPQVSYTGSIKVAGNEIGSFSGTKTGIAQYDFGSITRTSQRTGPVTLSMTLTFSNGSKWLDYKMRVWSQTTASSLSKIGKDGSIFATDTDDFHWFGPTQSIISHGVSNTEPPIQLTIDNQGVWNQGADIGGYVKVVNVGATSVNATLKDTLFVVPSTISSNVQINIPHQKNCVGKVYYFKNLSSRTVTVSAGDQGAIIQRDGTSASASRNIGNVMRMLIATTHGWLELY